VLLAKAGDHSWRARRAPSKALQHKARTGLALQTRTCYVTDTTDLERLQRSRSTPPEVRGIR